MAGPVRKILGAVLVGVAAVVLMVSTKMRPESFTDAERNMTYLAGAFALAFSLARIFLWFKTRGEGQ